MKHTLIHPLAALLLTILSLPALSQKTGQPLIDSLEKELPALKEDTGKVLALARLSDAWHPVNIQKAFAPAHEGLQLAEKLHWQQGIANLYTRLGLYTSDTGNNTLAREYFERSYAINTQLGSKANQAKLLINIGRSYLFEANYTKAADYYFKALPIAESLHDEEVTALVCSNMTSCFFNQKDLKKTAEYAEMTVQHAARTDNPTLMIRALEFWGIAKIELKDTAAGEAFLDSAISFAERKGFRVEMANVMVDKASLEPDIRKQIALNLQAEKILVEVSPNSGTVVIYSANLGSAYLSLAKDSTAPDKTLDKAMLLQKARYYLLRAKALAEKRNNTARQADILKMLVDLEETQGNYKVALDYQKRFNAINDSLFSQDKKNQIAGLEGRHALALKDDELALNQVRLSDQRKTSIALIAGLLLLGVIGILFYRQSRIRKKANTTLTELNQQLYEANAVKARFFGILSHDLRGPIINLLHFLHIQKDRPGLLNEAQQAAHQQSIQQSAENLLNTMEDMLLWSKEQMANFKPNFKTMPVNDLFGYLQKFFGQPENVRLVFDEATGLTLTTDENYLRTIMQNLTSNAVRILQETPGATVEWKARVERNEIILSIADNGPGLPPQLATTLTDDTTSDNARDGFGFHLIRDLARAIDCKLDIKTEPGKGTVFFLTLPTAA